MLYQLLAGFHPYDHSNDEDAPGEELDPEAQAQERRKLTAAKSWDEFRSQNGGGAMRVGETKRDRETSRMLAAAEKFVVSYQHSCLCWFCNDAGCDPAIIGQLPMCVCSRLRQQLTS